ncbi:MAG: tyrosine-type recombinase/integrase [Candidatus Babeliales bacterium]|jgi:integrase
MTRKTIGKTDTGKPIYETIGYFEDKELALNALVKSHTEPIIPKADITLKDLYDEWYPDKYEYISKQTEDCYRAAWNRLSVYGKVEFKELRTGHIQSVVNKCHKEGKSISTIKNIKILASMLYDYALQNDVVNKNYAEFVRLPKVEKEEKEIFTDLEIQKLEKAEGEPWVDTILILIYTGLRINELLSLTKFSINFENQTITGGLKTEAGKNRIIPIHPKILKYIKTWYDKNGEYLICNEKGKHLSDRVYRDTLYLPALDAHGVRKLNPHSCRHTCASLLAKAGADTLYIQRILGHAKYSFTADTYTRTDIEELRKAILKI